MNVFQVASTARRRDGEAGNQLFVGEVEPHNAERPWLVIRGAGAASEVVAVEPSAPISTERP